MRRSKLYKSRLEKIDRLKEYQLPEAIEILKSLPACKFDETVEMAFRLGINPRKSDQVVRGAMVLPNGIGKKINVVVIAEGDAATAAQEAGADEVGYEELLEKIKGGWMDFDILIATPSAMKVVRTLGRVLGPRGLMPNPKTGTVTDDTATAVKEAKAGRVEYRADKGGCVHVPIGKSSFTTEALVENAEAMVKTVERARPATVKGIYMQSIAVSSTMSPGLKLDVRNLTKA